MLDRCPLDYLTPDVNEFFEAMGYAETGVMPVLAGSRDQAHVFMEAMTYTRARLAEGRRHAAKHPERDDD